MSVSESTVRRRAGEVAFNHIKKGCLIILFKMEEAVDDVSSLLRGFSGHPRIH